MLVYDVIGSPPPTQEGITCLLVTGSVSLPPEQQEKNYCFCDRVGCSDTYLYAFVGNSDYESDKFHLFSQVDIEHTIEFKIIKKSNNQEYNLTDGVHGTLIQYDDSTVEFIVDWSKISNELGFGTYDLKIIRNYLGSERVQNFKTFLVLPFDSETADDTIRIKRKINGILENFADFKDYNIESQIRLRGQLNLTGIVTEVNTNPNANREQVQVHDREYNEYTLTINGINDDYYDLLVNNYLMSDIIEISDYNLMNKDFRNLRLRKESYEVKNVSKFNTCLEIKFVDYDQTKVKRT